MDFPPESTAEVKVAGKWLRQGDVEMNSRSKNIHRNDIQATISRCDLLKRLKLREQCKIPATNFSQGVERPRLISVEATEPRSPVDFTSSKRTD
jgi:hypothetical protein